MQLPFRCPGCWRIYPSALGHVLHGNELSSHETRLSRHRASHQTALSSLSPTQPRFASNRPRNYWAPCVKILVLHPFNGLFSRTTQVSWYQKGKNSLDLNDARDGALRYCGISWTIMQTICTLLQTDNHTNAPSFNFYRLDALPDTQPTVSKHWRHVKK